ADGNYVEKIPVNQADEFGRLSETFNQMMDGIAERELRIEHQALHDATTGLPNRLAFERRFEAAISAAEMSGARLSVYLVQVGRFGEINNTFGHDIGDALIKEISVMLRRIVKQNDIVARHSSNMFALLLPGAGLNVVDPIVQRILDQVGDPIGVAGHAIDVTLWIGEACFPEHGTSAKTLLQRADTAIFEAKRNIRHFAVYDPAQDPHKPEHLSTMGELHAGLERCEFKLFYQPKIDLNSDTVVAAEALIRWFHPSRGLVPPDSFIPLAEQTGNIHKLTAWVLEAAIAQIAAWRAMNLKIKIAVNLSARDLSTRRLPEDIALLLNRYRVNAADIIIELTESAVMADPGQSIDVLTALNKMGLGLAVDDYGIGYSSMAYIRRLPMQELKIDKSFVLKLASSAGDQIIVRSTVDLGHNLGLKVTAEGVEDQASLAILKDLGCGTGQGYFISKPLPAADFERFMRESRWAVRS
ncbi:MAG: EAL domain-containing protein, partial [Alphaproteobacteria bacterium]|nr:EAL domain-containing protein [Alphaproteobacteria bacterium]